MPLFDTMKQCEIDPKDLEGSDYIKAAMKKLPSVTFDKIVRTVDKALDNLRPTRSSALVWTKAGALFGRKSAEPLKDVNHLWEKGNLIFDGVPLLKFVGTILMWRISLRDDTWLLHRFKTGEIDPMTGKEIKINQYWIDNDYELPKEPDAVDLMKKFNRRI